jgi:MFS family permease
MAGLMAALRIDKCVFYRTGASLTRRRLLGNAIRSWYKATQTSYPNTLMNRGFYTIMAAQFFSSLADTALLFVAIDLLASQNAPESLKPLLKLSFVLFYVILAAFVGAFADAFPKGRVMFIANLVKIFGCSLLFMHVHPLLAYSVVGFGAAVYSPAKYGILTELLPPEKLVVANGWIEGLTVMSIILGTMMARPSCWESIFRTSTPASTPRSKRRSAWWRARMCWRRCSTCASPIPAPVTPSKSAAPAA